MSGPGAAVIRAQARRLLACAFDRDAFDDGRWAGLDRAAPAQTLHGVMAARRRADQCAALQRAEQYLVGLEMLGIGLGPAETPVDPAETWP